MSKSAKSARQLFTANLFLSSFTGSITYITWINVLHLHHFAPEAAQVQAVELAMSAGQGIESKVKVWLWRKLWSWDCIPSCRFDSESFLFMLQDVASVQVFLGQSWEDSVKMCESSMQQHAKSTHDKCVVKFPCHNESQRVTSKDWAHVSFRPALEIGNVHETTAILIHFACFWPEKIEVEAQLWHVAIRCHWLQDVCNWGWAPLKQHIVI